MAFESLSAPGGGKIVENLELAVGTHLFDPISFDSDSWHFSFDFTVRSAREGVASSVAVYYHQVNSDSDLAVVDSVAAEATLTAPTRRLLPKDRAAANVRLGLVVTGSPAVVTIYGRELP
jgi:hypothetical protein